MSLLSNQESDSTKSMISNIINERTDMFITQLIIAKNSLKHPSPRDNDSCCQTALEDPSNCQLISCPGCHKEFTPKKLLVHDGMCYSCRMKQVTGSSLPYTHPIRKM